MKEHSAGGYIPGSIMVSVLRGPRREAVSPEMFSIYADECFLNTNRICIRNDEWHRGVSIPADRKWVCPVHDRT